MRITRLQAENFKRLVAVDITPEGHVQLISGANAQGKSSVLDAIAYALAGSKAGKLDRPVRDGADHAEVTVDLGEYVVTRKWRGDRSTLEVKLPGGASVPSPQKLLDSLIGKLSFDPLSFANAEPKDQRRMLMEVAGLLESDNELARVEREYFDLRTEVNRDAKKARAAVDSMEKPTVDDEAKTVDVAAVYADLSKLETEAQEFERLAASVRQVDEELASLERRREELLVTKAGMQQRGRDLRNADRGSRIQRLRADLETAGETNRQIEAAKRYRALEAEAKDQEAHARQLTEQIETVRKARAVAVQQAQLPIVGLSVDDDGVLFNGVPFTQSSAAERMRVSLAMAMAMNPELRVLRLEDASLLDSVSRAMIEQAAVDNDFQIWLEVVDETKGVGIAIEDGQVAN